MSHIFVGNGGTLSKVHFFSYCGAYYVSCSYKWFIFQFIKCKTMIDIRTSKKVLRFLLLLVFLLIG